MNGFPLINPWVSVGGLFPYSWSTSVENYLLIEYQQILYRNNQYIQIISVYTDYLLISSLVIEIQHRVSIDNKHHG